MSLTEYLIFDGDGRRVKFNNVNLATFDIASITNIPNNCYLISFGRINENAPKEIIWDFLKKNKNILNEIRSLHFIEQIKNSYHIEYFYQQLKINDIIYSLSNFSRGTIFTINEYYLPNNNNNTSIKYSLSTFINNIFSYE
jgi:hypothetical protein